MSSTDNRMGLELSDFTYEMNSKIMERVTSNFNSYFDDVFERVVDLMTRTLKQDYDIDNFEVRDGGKVYVNNEYSQERTESFKIMFVIYFFECYA